MIFSSAILAILLALSSTILLWKHHNLPAKYEDFTGKQSWFGLSRDLIVNRRKLYRLPAPTRSICVWQKHGEICLFPPFSHQDIRIAMDIEIQPGPYSPIPGSRSLQYSQLIHTTFDGSTVNFNFPARNTAYHYSRQQLLNLRSLAPVSTNLFLSLKGLGILKTRRVRAGKTEKQRTSAIPVIIGRRNEKTTQVSFSDQKLPYYYDVNKPSKRGSAAIDLNIASAHVHAQNHSNLTVATSREQNNSKCFNALQNRQSKSQCLSFIAATINCESANNKTLDLTDYISEQDIDVSIRVRQRAGREPTVTAGEVCPPGYELQSIPRKDRRGGGVAVILKQPLSFKSSQYCPPNSFQSFEHLNTVILHPHYSKSIDLTVVYRPPRSDKNNVPTSVFLDEISELFAALSMTLDRLLITGGFNVHVDTPNDPTAAKFLSVLESFGLVQHVAVPTSCCWSYSRSSDDPRGLRLADLLSRGVLHDFQPLHRSISSQHG